jgi:hypothetical protein
MKRIHQRGHQIGLHCSYGSYQSASAIASEFRRLKSLCAELGIEQTHWQARQHWLRFKMPETFQLLDDAGLDSDTTMTFERSIGFRSGTCRPFPVYNLKTRHKLRLIEQPTVAMDASITDAGTMNLGVGPEALQAVQNIVNQCRVMRGECVLLWHNSRLMRSADLHFYRQVLAA